MTFALLLILFIVVVFQAGRIGTLSERLNTIERHLDLLAGRIPAAEPKAKEAEGQAPAPAPEPAPAPLPNYSKEEKLTPPPALTKEESEERSARWLGRIGAVAVILGVAFFLKYAFDNDWIGPAGRVTLGLIAGSATLALAWRLRAKYLLYSDILMGCGIGVLYLSMYASYGFYHLVDVATAFVLMGLITALAIALAAAGSSLSLGIIAILGGFLTPVLLSTGEDHLVTLSVYMILLDLGVFGMAWFKKWTQVNYLSFIGTVTLLSGWAMHFYAEDKLAVTFFFATVFFLIFLATSLLSHIVRKEKTGVYDLALIALNAGVYLWTSYLMLDPHFHAYLGLFAFICALLYLAVAYLAFSMNREDRALNLFLPGVAIVFLTVAIPLQFTGHWVPVMWVSESLVLVAIGLYIIEPVIQAFGWIVLLVGMIDMVGHVEELRQCGDLFGSQLWSGSATACTQTPFWNAAFFLMMFAVATFYGMAWLYYRFQANEKTWKEIAFFAVVFANFATLWAFLSEVGDWQPHFTSVVWFIESVVLLVLGLRARLRIVEVIGWILYVCGLSAMISAVSDIRMEEGISAFANTGTFLMLLAVATIFSFFAFYRRLGSGFDAKQACAWILVFANLLTVASITSEISFGYDQQIRLEQGNSSGMYLYGTYQAPNNIQDITAPESAKQTAVSVFWTIYATILIVIGFVRRNRLLRLFGLAFFFITALKVFVEVWQLGELERIISSIVFGAVALGASFIYAKYKGALKEMIYKE